MKFSELKAAFESYIGAVGEAEDASLALWLNEAQLDLAYDFGAIRTEGYSAVAGAGQVLPEDALVLLDATDTYIINALGQIVFENGGSVDLYYRAVPADFSGLDQEQESTLPKAVHNLMAIFAVSRYWDKESDGDAEESGHATKWLSYYYQGKNTAKAKLNAVGGNHLDRWIVTD